VFLGRSLIDQNLLALGPFYHLAKYCQVLNPYGQLGRFDNPGEGSVIPHKCLVSLNNEFASQVWEICLHEFIYFLYTNLLNKLQERKQNIG